MVTCFKCQGTGKVLSHNPICFECQGTGKITAERSLQVKLNVQNYARRSKLKKDIVARLGELSIEDLEKLGKQFL